MKKITFLLISVLLLQGLEVIAQIRLPRLISDSMVLQRDADIKMWGWAAPNEKVLIRFVNREYTTTASIAGEWHVTLPPHSSGGPYTMELEASNKIIIKDILFGDVWVASGQSNMELTMERVKERYDDIIKSSENSNIRQFLVPDQYDFKKEQADLESGSWIKVDPKNLLDFSAVAYFFASQLYDEYNIPIGIINAALGGSPVEAWMSEKSLSNFPEAYQELHRFKNDSLITAIEESDKVRIDTWYQELESNDKGLLEQWYEPDTRDEDWDNMNIPGYWADNSTGDLNGSVWFRKSIDIPKTMLDQTAQLWMGRIVDQDFVYVNGKLVGTTGYQYPPRRYKVPSDVLKEGINTITVRVVNSSGKGGFVLDKPYYLAVGKDTIDLKGVWKYKLGTSMPELGSQTFVRWKPGGLYNKMIAPLLNYSIKGVIWYQGESNTSNPHPYAALFRSMITDWRTNWQQGDFPFLYVQLSNFMEETTDPSESTWAQLRQEQLETLSVPNTAMVVTTDIGEWNDIHPLNKYDVGKRLARAADKIVYQGSNGALSPVPKKADFNRSEIVIEFENVGNGLVASDGDSLRHFSISNDGKNFFWAEAKIKGDKVVVYNSKVQNPSVVRYAWANNPGSANLSTKDGFPASPFEVRK